MEKSTKQRKVAASHIPQAMGQDVFTQKLVKVVAEGKAAFDSLSFDLGRTLYIVVLVRQFLAKSVKSLGVYGFCP